MRTRRQVIIGGTATMMGLTGCLDEVPEEDGGDDGGNGTGAGDGTDGMNETGGDGRGGEGNETTADGTATALFEPSFSAAPSAEVGRNVDWSLTVENTGDADGTFETSVDIRGPGGDETSSTVSLDIAAGETVETSSSFRPDYVGEYTVTVEGTGEEHTVTAETRTLGFGDEYVNPDGVTVTVDGTEEFYEVRLVSSYTYTDENGERRFERAAEGSEFAVVSVRSSKEGRRLVEMPRRDEFTMFVGGGAYSPVERLADDGYEGGTTRGRDREGVVVFEVDEDAGREDTFEVYWEREYDGGVAEAIWST